MRLVCPNCDAEYEVDDAAIPRTGRDVQCSNCGHAWFQLHPEVIAAEEEEEALFGQADDEAAPEPEEALSGIEETAPSPAPDLPPHTVETPETAPTEPPRQTQLPEAPPPEPPPAPPAPAARSVDASILAMLREEAEREAAARRAEMPALETQTEMPLEPAAATSRVPVPPSAAPQPASEDARPRRELLPAIEEINSSLRASSERSPDEGDAAVPDEAAEQNGSGGFRTGFLMLVLLGVIVLALYVFAPLIAAKVPALAGAAQTYVAFIDAARLWLDTEIRSLIAWLRGIAGGAQG